MTMFKCDGYDPSGVIRVYGYGATKSAAKQQCQAALMSYTASRPDTQPLAKWTFRVVKTAANGRYL